MLPTEAGGRRKSVYNNFRPSVSFNIENQISGEVSFPGLEELKPGNTTKAIVKLLPSKHIRQNLKSGDAFTVLEGEKIVGTGIIQQIRNKLQTTD